MYGFTPAERKVARHLLLGRDMKLIAEEIGFTHAMVKKLASNCYVKTGQDNAVGFVMFLLRRGSALAEVMELDPVRR